VVSDKLAEYNQLRSTLDQRRFELEGLERALQEKSLRFLAVTKGKYGPNSGEYKQVGGIRTVDRKRPSRKRPAPASTPSKPPATPVG